METPVHFFVTDNDNEMNTTSINLKM